VCVCVRVPEWQQDLHAFLISVTCLPRRAARNQRERAQLSPDERQQCLAHRPPQHRRLVPGAPLLLYPPLSIPLSLSVLLYLSATHHLSFSPFVSLSFSPF